ncbi:UHRF1 [Branchiostoma lanceolatum]|uniref:UHRF1 protein n=1 Tax=Branchiostoma lanceolatum TaxID=7740 RepID=A0A8K0EU13_BRALA|nr:UHRF1 [Branchiostoma lanceolatum]
MAGRYISPYEEKRLKNMEENRRILESLGLVGTDSVKPKRVVKKKAPLKRKKSIRVHTPAKRVILTDGLVNEQVDTDQDGFIPTRRSARLREKAAPSLQELRTEVDEELEAEEEKDTRYKPVPKDRPNVFGEIPGFPVGTWFERRMEACLAGVHRPPVAGVHGNDYEGCYSLVLSGGHEDYGEYFTYTGNHTKCGRDLNGTKANPKNLRTAPQSKDQTLTRGNLALSVSVETRRPVRVMRGYKLDSSFAPEEGYRYDGLYSVDKFWFTAGLSGFGVYKFLLSRCPDQAPPPWTLPASGDNSDSDTDTNKADSDSGVSMTTGTETESD